MVVGKSAGPRPLVDVRRADAVLPAAVPLQLTTGRFVFTFVALIVAAFLKRPATTTPPPLA